MRAVGRPDMDFQVLIGNADVRYFSLGRFALTSGLQLLAKAPGTSVLLPAFICRDLLAAIHAAGYVPVFYPVSDQMEPATAPENWPDAAAVMAVNYFGFPQALEPFRRYCQRTGACLIEDNAHGLLSRDAAGQLLGTRGDLGIFSLRKTMPLPDGAALVVNDPTRRSRLEAQLPFDALRRDPSFAIKQRLSKLPLVGNAAVRFTVAGTRLWRQVRTGSALPNPGSEIETIIPGPPNPHAGLLARINSLDVERECQRRQSLYAEVDRRLKLLGVRTVFPSLDSRTIPYGIPFFGDNALGARVNKAIRSLHLEAFRWPELPAAVIDVAPMHYRNVWWVNFLVRS